MTKHQKIGLYTAIFAILGFIGLLLLFYYSFGGSDTSDSYHAFDGADIHEEDDLLEVIVPMSCTYRGKLKLDTATQSSLKKYQSILN